LKLLQFFICIFKVGAVVTIDVRRKTLPACKSNECSEKPGGFERMQARIFSRLLPDKPMPAVAISNIFYESKYICCDAL